MRIVMLSRLYEPHKGGVEKHAHQIALQATSAGHHVDIFTLAHDPSLAHFEIIDALTVHRLVPTWANKYCERVLIWTWLLSHIWTFLRADIIHIHDVFFWYWPLRFLLFWKKVTITFHGFEAGFLPTKKAIENRRRAKQWTRASMGVGRWIEKWYGTACDVYTYGGADCVHTSEKSEGKMRCVFVGRREEDTGIFVYERVCKKLGIMLDVFGQNQKKGLVQDTCLLYPKYDIACVSSYLSILEAMQSKVLVVAYVSDALKKDYIYSHPRFEDMVICESEKQLSDFFRHYDEKKYDLHVQRAYQWARQQTWQRVYQKYEKLWSI